MKGYEALAVLVCDTTRSASFQGGEYNVYHGRLRTRPMKLLPSSATNWWKQSALTPLAALDEGWELLP